MHWWCEAGLDNYARLNELIFRPSVFDVPLLPGRKDNPLWSGFIERPFEALSGPLGTGGTCVSCVEGRIVTSLMEAERMLRCQWECIVKAPFYKFT